MKESLAELGNILFIRRTSWKRCARNAAIAYGYLLHGS